VAEAPSARLLPTARVCSRDVFGCASEEVRAIFVRF